MKLNNGIEISDKLIEEGITGWFKNQLNRLATPPAQPSQPTQQSQEQPAQPATPTPKVPAAIGGAKNGIGFLRELDLSTIMPSGNVPDTFYDNLEKKAEAIIKKRLGVR